MKMNLPLNNPQRLICHKTQPINQVSRTLLSILANLNNAVVWMVSAHPPHSKSLEIFPSTPIITGTTVIFMYHSFFSSLVRFKYLSLFLFSWIFYSVVHLDGKVHYSAGPLFLGIITSSGDLFGSQNPREFCISHSPGCILGCAYTIWLYGQILIYCTIPSGSPFPPSCVSSCTLFALVCCLHL